MRSQKVKVRSQPRRKICIVTDMQPSANPRVVKEATALAAAGYQVSVLCGYMNAWAAEADRALCQNTNGIVWKYVGGSPRKQRLKYYWTRLRSGIARRTGEIAVSHGVLDRYRSARIGPELCRGAWKEQADLFVAHGPAALVAAARAAAGQRSLLAYDAEDFNSGMSRYGEGRLPSDELAERVEREFLPGCTYVTAASPLISQAYAEAYRMAPPVTILNVYPLELQQSVLPRAAVGSPLRLFWFSQTIGRARGLEQVLEAMCRLRNLKMELHLQGAWQEGYEEELRSYAGQLGLGTHQIIWREPSPLVDVVRNARECDVGLALELNVSRNREICLTNKIFLYMLAGNAIVATSTDGQRQLMNSVPGVGVCFDEGDVRTLTKWLHKWYHDRSALFEVKQVSWQSAKRIYNWDREKRKLIGLVSATLSSNRSTVRYVAGSSRYGTAAPKSAVSAAVR